MYPKMNLMVWIYEPLGWIFKISEQTKRTIKLCIIVLRKNKIRYDYTICKLVWRYEKFIHSSFLIANKTNQKKIASLFLNLPTSFDFLSNDNLHTMDNLLFEFLNRTGLLSFLKLNTNLSFRSYL